MTAVYDSRVMIVVYDNWLNQLNVTAVYDSYLYPMYFMWQLYTRQLFISAYVTADYDRYLYKLYVKAVYDNWL